MPRSLALPQSPPDADDSFRLCGRAMLDLAITGHYLKAFLLLLILLLLDPCRALLRSIFSLNLRCLRLSTVFRNSTKQLCGLVGAFQSIYLRKVISHKCLRVHSSLSKKALISSWSSLIGEISFITTTGEAFLDSEGDNFHGNCY